MSREIYFNHGDADSNWDTYHIRSEERLKLCWRHHIHSRQSNSGICHPYIHYTCYITCFCVKVLLLLLKKSLPKLQGSTLPSLAFPFSRGNLGGSLAPGSLVTHLDARWNLVGIAINLPKDILLTSSIVVKVTPQMWSKFLA